MADVEAHIIAALRQEHRQELARLHTQLQVYRSCLLAHGIEPPDMEGDDLLRLYQRSRAVIEAASELVAELGTSKELMFPFRRPEAA